MSMLHPIPPPPPESASVPAPQPSGPDERDMLLRLRALHETARIRVTVNCAKLSHMDFPLGLEADGNRWAYAIVIVIVAIWWFLGPYAGIASAVAGFALYQTVGQRYVERRLQARIHDRGLGEIDIWRKLWRFGGVILTDPATAQTCQGPDGRWMDFVRVVDRTGTP
ncbi:MAG: hypothetical protein JWO51_2591 [Rhodospirillales bacterium]|nr:hypothetical protein [Rhodospirillales bacterium]